MRFTTQPKVLSAAAMNAAQHEILRALLQTYIGRMPDVIAEREMAKLTGGGPKGRAHRPSGANASALRPHNTLCRLTQYLFWSTDGDQSGFRR